MFTLLLRSPSKSPQLSCLKVSSLFSLVSDHITLIECYMYVRKGPSQSRPPQSCYSPVSWPRGVCVSLRLCTPKEWSLLDSLNSLMSWAPMWESVGLRGWVCPTWRTHRPACSPPPRSLCRYSGAWSGSCRTSPPPPPAAGHASYLNTWAGNEKLVLVAQLWIELNMTGLRVKTVSPDPIPPARVCLKHHLITIT